MYVIIFCVVSGGDTKTVPKKPVIRDAFLFPNLLFNEYYKNLKSACKLQSMKGKKTALFSLEPTVFEPVQKPKFCEVRY
jgi:hypothetical protein